MSDTDISDDIMPVEPDPAPVTIDRRTEAELAERVDVFDAATGAPIQQVIAADSSAGTVMRYAVVDGCLVRGEDDAFVIVTEQRAVEIAWRAPDEDAA